MIPPRVDNQYSNLTRRRHILKKYMNVLLSFRAPLTSLTRRVWRESREDNLLGLAAQMSFFFALALFPFFILLAALAGTVPSTGLWNHVLRWVTLYLPESSQAFVFSTVSSLTQGHEKFLSIGVFSAAWAASGGILTLMSSLNSAYEVTETRGLGKRAAIAVFMLFVLCFLFLGSFGLLTAAHLLATWVAAHTAPGLPLPAVWQIGHWLVSLLLLVLGMAVIYSLLPNHRQPWHWITPGALLVVITWIPGSLAFNSYVRHIGTYSRIYGEMEAFMVLMVWIYIVSIIVLLGAEINCELLKMRRGNAASSGLAGRITAGD